ncbi:MAG: HEAT repeat domain-containing protein [Candidatus Uhrbacteria bacterium]
MEKKNLIAGKDRRGFTTKKEDEKFSNFLSSVLIENLLSSVSKIWTSAAKILGQRKYLPAINPLCKQLTKEDKLYTKIAICEALENIGETAVPILIGYLGKIGHNQYKQLPNKFFNKWNYPCPRDIVARTIAKIGEPALPYLIKVLETKNVEQISEAIDAIGKISFYSKNFAAQSVLKKCLQKYLSNELIVWKIIRAFEAFPVDDVIRILEKYLKNSEQKMLRWEAIRSLAQIGGEKSREILSEVLIIETDAETRKNLSKAIKRFR